MRLAFFAVCAAVLVTHASAAPDSGTYKCSDGQTFAVDFGDETAVVTLDGKRIVMVAVSDGSWADPDSGLALIQRGKALDITRDFKPYLSACMLDD